MTDSLTSFSESFWRYAKLSLEGVVELHAAQMHEFGKLLYGEVLVSDVLCKDRLKQVKEPFVLDVCEYFGVRGFLVCYL